jgi:hypothetical protein
MNMPTIRNRMFQPLGLMLSDGTMLHLPPRAEHEVPAAELDTPPFKAALATGQLALLARAPVELAAPEPRRRKPRKA